MQLLLIFGIAFAIGAVAFALQNNTPVSVNFILWSFDSSLAMVLLLSLGLGAIIAGLVTSPTVIKGQWNNGRLRRQVAELERDKAALTEQLRQARAETQQLRPADAVIEAEPKPYVGLKTLIAGQGSHTEAKGS